MLGAAGASDLVALSIDHPREMLHGIEQREAIHAQMQEVHRNNLLRGASSANSASRIDPNRKGRKFSGDVLVNGRAQGRSGGCGRRT
ncbi:hypothetical protein GUITHDRAFT_111294 [Guillardia theta CCMP2712]|uniref:Uncharacterized protein n=1 Tax=Guillardia theta (strain CCMP2712) TaxID=905079 RepID=L1J3D7_GUITC|nr:hypothetical protein GUITHDRAFT_111294 [Guillardia theta CCMP2712]EKX42610.1 hypothetical protein GUITHDRAFT_111294 [Guillardia theta CCMP2712]|eukprot:XP_005829590.1 hypothetical protein GUITHDRAFT_111294 [Guillardia theta CCMP2712]